jgi:hypothetical protein
MLSRGSLGSLCRCSHCVLIIRSIRSSALDTHNKGRVLLFVSLSVRVDLRNSTESLRRPTRHHHHSRISAKLSKPSNPSMKGLVEKGLLDGVPKNYGLHIPKLIDQIYADESSRNCLNFEMARNTRAAAIAANFSKHVDVCDNPDQAKAIQHHYSSGLNDLSQDYSENAVIYETIDDRPLTLHGPNGVRQSATDLLGVLRSTTLELEHIKVCKDHAQVIWKAETPEHTFVYGTDWFTFDQNNRIVSQATVVLSEENQALN